MSHIQASYAVVKGFGYCTGRPEIRRFAVWPWAIGAGIYLLSAFFGIYFFGTMLNALVGTPAGIWQHVVYYVAALLLAVFLVIAIMIITLTLVIVLSSVFQTAIAAAVLRDQGVPLPPERGGTIGVIQETGRTIAVESTKLLWLLPLGLISILLFLVPLLFPIALVLAAWLLAFQFVDIVLDVLKVRAFERLRFGIRHMATLLVFGLTLMLICIIPFAGLLIPPVAAAGAAWLLAESRLLERFTGPESYRRESDPNPPLSRESMH